MAEQLYIRTGKNAGTSVDLYLKTLPAFAFPVFLIGTDPRCHLVLDDPDAARVHAVIARSKSGPLMIKRYQSHLKLTLDGEYIDQGRLYDGCVIRLGKSTLSFAALPDVKAVAARSTTAPFMTPASLISTPPTPALSAAISPVRKPAPKSRQRKSLLSASLVLIVIAGLSALVPLVITATRVKEGIDIILKYVDSPEDLASLIELAPPPGEIEYQQEPSSPSQRYPQGPVLANPNRLALLYFKAEWCSYCRAEAPVIQDVQSYYQSIMDTMVIDVDSPDNSELVYGYNVRALPHMVLIDDEGNILNNFYGYTEGSVLSRSIESAYYQ